MIGGGILSATVIVVLVEAVPDPSVTVTVYVVLTAGVTVIVGVVSLVLHKYVSVGSPVALAVSVTEELGHTVTFPPIMVTVGPASAIPPKLVTPVF